MHTSQFFSLPLTNPTLIFAVVLLVILFSPLLLNKLRVPHIVGLMLAGMCLGPFGFNVLSNDDSFQLFGNVGLLYILFIAGVQTDLNDLRKNRLRGGVFGVLTFIIPILLVYLAALWIFSLHWVAALLVASMCASHTLVAYPIVTRFRLANQRAVRIASVGSIVTVVLALGVLTLITGRYTVVGSGFFWLEWSVRLVIFASVILWLFPKITHSFFKRFEDSILQYIFILALVFLGSFLAQAAGLEAVLGAFMVGIAINKLIPNVSPLMNRLEFVGSALFIPFFLLSIGMQANIRLLAGGYEPWIAAAVMILLTVGSKWMAAFLTQKTFRLNRWERLMMFGLSNGQAAATLAAMSIGYSIVLPDGAHLLPGYVMVGAILMILITGIVSSVVTETAAHKLVSEGNNRDDKQQGRKRRERFLLPVSNAIMLESQVETALLMKDTRSREDIYALHVFNDVDDDLKAHGTKLLDQAAKFAMVADQWVERIMRYDVNVASGILYTVKEYAVSDLIVGMHSKRKPKDTLLGASLAMLLNGLNRSLFIIHADGSLRKASRIVLFLPHKAELERGFESCFAHVRMLTRNIGTHLVIYATDETRHAVARISRFAAVHVSQEFRTIDDSFDCAIETELLSDDLLVVFRARPLSISFNEKYETMATQLSSSSSPGKLLIVYPEQQTGTVRIDEQFSAWKAPRHQLVDKVITSLKWARRWSEHETKRLLKKK
jgi:Kef-type K+ transport system membrane component KefB